MPNIFHQYFSRVRIFSLHEMKYIWYLPKKGKFSFILYSTEIQKAQPNLFLGRFTFDSAFDVCLLSITMGADITPGQTVSLLCLMLTSQHALRYF